MSPQSRNEDMERAGALLPPGLALRWYDRLDSTNTLALNAPHLPAGTIIAADSQSAGRGRLGRAWHSPPGLNLYFSLVLCPSLPRQHWGGFSLAAGVGAARGLAELSLQPRLKWPNDVLLEGEKLAGILLESGNGRLTVGVGVNVNQEDFPPDLRATSLRRATGRSWRQDLVLAALARQIWHWCRLWQEGEFERVIGAWRRRCYPRPLRYRPARREAIEGVAVDVAPTVLWSVEDCERNSPCLAQREVTLKK